MTFIKAVLAVAVVSAVVATAATTHEHGKSRDYSNHIGQTEQWDAPVAAPSGATGIPDLDLIY